MRHPGEGKDMRPPGRGQEMRNEKRYDGREDRSLSLASRLRGRVRQGAGAAGLTHGHGEITGRQAMAKTLAGRRLSASDAALARPTTGWSPFWLPYRGFDQWLKSGRVGRGKGVEVH